MENCGLLLVHLLVLEAVSYEAQDGLWSSCLHLLSIGTAGVTTCLALCD